MCTGGAQAFLQRASLARKSLQQPAGKTANKADTHGRVFTHQKVEQRLHEAVPGHVRRGGGRQAQGCHGVVLEGAAWCPY